MSWIKINKLNIKLTSLEEGIEKFNFLKINESFSFRGINHR